MNSWELQEEKELADIFKRPMRYFTHDLPTYPWLPTQPIVDFDLKFTDK